MRANRYIQNSDFLSLAMVYKGTGNVTFSARSVAPNARVFYSQRFYAPLYVGAIDNYNTKINGSDPMYGSFITFLPGNGDNAYNTVRFFFIIDSDGYVKIEQQLINYSSVTWNVPQYNLEVFMQRFAPPDLF